MTIKFYQIVLFETALALLLGYILWQVVTRLRRGEAWIGNAVRPPVVVAEPPAPKAKSKRPRAKADKARSAVDAPPAPQAEAPASPAAANEEKPKPKRAAPRAKAANPRKPAAQPPQAVAAPAPESAAELSLYSEIEARLEKNFALFEAGTITLDGFERILTAEQMAAQMRFDGILGDTDKAHLAEFQDRCADAEQAMVAIQWCLNWAQDMRRKAA